MKLRVLSEGALDIGDADAPVEQPATPRRERRIGAVRVLVRRILEAALAREVKEWEVDAKRLPRAHNRSADVSGFPHKVQLAIVDAGADGCSAVAIVVDRDGASNGGRLATLVEGRDLAAAAGEVLATKTAIGVAIETVEAWLLADELALNKTLVPETKIGALPSPEGLSGGKGTDRHPKVMLRRLIEAATRETDRPYDEIAETCRLDIVEKRCPDGFAPFADDVRRRCL